MISGHVDDFVFCGRSDDEEWQAVLEKMRQRFQGGDWEDEKFASLC